MVDPFQPPNIIAFLPSFVSVKRLHGKAVCPVTLGELHTSEITAIQRPDYANYSTNVSLT